MREGGEGSTGSGGGTGGFGTGGFGTGGSGQGGMGGGFGAGRGKFFDDLAGMAGGAFSVFAGAKAEVESAVQAQVEALATRLNLVRREELDAALEVARRAREEAEALAVRVAALEARMPPAGAAPATSPVTAAEDAASDVTGGMVSGGI